MRRDSPDRPERASRWRPGSWVTPLLLGLVCMLVFNANLRVIGSGDTLPARYLPLITLKDHTLGLGANARLVAHGHPVQRPPAQAATPGEIDYVTYLSPHSYWIAEGAHGRLGSLYPVVTPVAITPLYYPAYRYLQGRGWAQPELDRVAEIMEKLSASLLASIAAVLMFVLLRREQIPWALPLAAVFAFGTNTWVISSQALWQHGAGQLLIILALLLAMQRGSPARMAGLGFVCVLIAANRPPDAIVAAAFFAFAVWRDRRDLPWLLAGAALPALGLLAYNVALFGNPIGGYTGKKGAAGAFLRFDPLGPAGLLVSPARGLLIFTPFLIFVPLGLRLRLRDPATRKLAIALTVAVVAQLLIYSQTDWRAGASWGPRWLTNILPILVWMLAPAIAELRPAGRRILVATMVASVAAQAIGAFWYTGVSDERVFAGDPASMKAAWKPANFPPLVELGHQPAKPELLCNAKGSVDKVGKTIVDDPSVVPELRPGDPIEGWAYACLREPAQILVLADGVLIGATEAFTPRPDIVQVFGAEPNTGWRIEASTRGLSPGPHVLQLAARVGPRSGLRIIRELTVQILKPPPGPRNDLPSLAARASQQLRERQEQGYWLTQFTASPRFQVPGTELNTYTPAVIVDLLAPIVADAGLARAVQRTRSFLAEQIEPSGLVRYHGLPNAPGIGTLGCVITPDVDDTALTWRIAGPGKRDPRYRAMRRTIERYRDERGLYRTWLAPVDQYECLDPGDDPNPADLVNQLHVYLMLRELDPPAARTLCTAIQRVASDPAALAYYVNAPLVLYLRSAELASAGCRLPLPAAQLASVAPGQEPWAELVAALAKTTRTPPTAAERRASDELLMRLARDDFTLLRRTPPLLYSNDPTATVSRFYWSEDAGYALWLRLYAATRAATP